MKETNSTIFHDKIYYFFLDAFLSFIYNAIDYNNYYFYLGLELFFKINLLIMGFPISTSGVDKCRID